MSKSEPWARQVRDATQQIAGLQQRRREAVERLDKSLRTARKGWNESDATFQSRRDESSAKATAEVYDLAYQSSNNAPGRLLLARPLP